MIPSLILMQDLMSLVRRPNGGMKAFRMPKGGFRNNRVSISFSGGKTSGYMTRMVLEYLRVHHPEVEVIVTFANTGEEHEETLRFVDRCDKEFGFNVVWLEAKVVHGSKKSTGFKVVNFETASRNGEPFEDVISKYGLPNKTWNLCTRETKLNPMKNYLKSRGWDHGSYSVAVGIRSDEIDRVSLAMMKLGIFYPCIDAGVTKEDVRIWWLEQPFNLNIPEHFGNCKSCWKKSFRKLLTITQTNPEFFDFWRRMEDRHSFTGTRPEGLEGTPRQIFRENSTVEDLFERAKQGFEPYVDGKFIPFDTDMDYGSACGESCEVFADLTE